MDIAKGEATEQDLDLFIERRHDQRVAAEGERAEEELWAVSAAKYAARRQRELAQQWLAYHIARRRTHRHTFALLDAHHAQEIARYTAMLDDGKESA